MNISADVTLKSMFNLWNFFFSILSLNAMMVLQESIYLVNIYSTKMSSKLPLQILYIVVGY
jgi:hypothetical protein